MAANASKTVPCAGFVVFNSDSTKVVMVSTPRGNLSFPKGKRNKGETDLETAFRELREETGLSEETIVRIGNEYVDEMSNKGHPNVRYFVCRIKDDRFKFIIEDEEELASVEWYDVNRVDSLPNLKNQRKDVLKRANLIISAHT
jgi:8-oxo-dGTP pyrophosphatase MutT (NUDIX family)